MADPDDKRGPGRAEAVRSAAVQAFQSTAGQAGITRERAQDLADALAQAAGRLIGAFDELRPASADDVRSLRAVPHRVQANVSRAGRTRRHRPGKQNEETGDR